ncbi:hypothetical protein KCP77_20370 [Salmonella enterica subsp. enterica]|nr:hypothetical protein KCP77_20370 [Salmonella enterica subsp. enterica]
MPDGATFTTGRHPAKRMPVAGIKYAGNRAGILLDAALFLQISTVP